MPRRARPSARPAGRSRLRAALWRLRERGPAAGLGAAVVFSIVGMPLLGGTIEPPYTLVAAAVLGLGAACAAGVARRRGERVRLSWFGVLLALALAASLLQLVPLPPGLRAVLSPGSDPVLRHVLGAPDLARYPQHAYPLSVDPAATSHEAVRLAGALCLLVSLGVWARRRERAQPGSVSVPLGRLVLLAGAAVAGLGALAALGVPLPAPLGVPGTGTTRALLPACFVNSNHQAALLALAATVGIGLLRAAPGRPERAVLACLIVLCDVALLGTLSRAGVLCGGLGQLAALVLTRRGTPGAPRTLFHAAGAVLLCAVVTVALLALFPALRHGLAARFTALAPESLLAPGSKVRAWLEALPLLRAHWPLGVGRGGFGAAFQGVHSLSAHTRFPYLENEPLQTALDFGVPVALLLAGALVLALRDVRRRGPLATRRPRSPVRLAALVALVALGVHGLFDFNLAAGGVLSPALVLCALVEAPRFRVPPLALLGLSLLTVAGALGVLCAVPDAEADAAHLRALATDARVPASEVVCAARAAVQRHPLESDFGATVAARLTREDPDAALPWANRALLANPRDLGARTAAAQILAARGYRDQARALLLQALADADAAQERWLLPTALALSRSPDEFVSLLPATAAAADVALDALGTATPPRWDLVRALAARAAPLGSARAAEWGAIAALAQRDLDGAEAAVIALGDPAAAPAFLLGNLLSLLAESGDPPRVAFARARAEAALARADRPEYLLALALARLHAAPGSEDGLRDARAALDHALTLPLATPLRARIHEVRGDLEAAAGNPHRAAAERAEAARLRATP